MEKRFQLKKQLCKSDNQEEYIIYTYDKKIILSSFRIILQNKYPFIIRLNHHSLYFMIRSDYNYLLRDIKVIRKNHKGWDNYGNMYIYPEYDTLNNYYYFDIKFNYEFQINDLFLIKESEYDTNIFIEYDNDKYIEYQNEYIKNEDFKKEYYIMIYNNENLDDSIINTDIKYVNNSENFKLELIKNNIYKLTLFEDDFIETIDWNLSEENKKKEKIYTILSVLPIINFPNYPFM